MEKVSNTKYPRAFSKVTINFINGEVKEYVISAGLGISAYLAREAGSCGVLVLKNEDIATYGIPIVSIRDWIIEPLPMRINDARLEDQENQQDQTRINRGSDKSLEDDIPF